MTGVLVTLDGVDVTCEVAEPARIGRGRRHPAEGFAPAQAALDLVTGRPVRRGAPLTVEMNAPATDPRWETTPGTWADQSGTWADTRRRLVLFAGTVTDVATSWQVTDTGPAPATRLIAVDPLGLLLGLDTGTTDWPAETAAVRLARLALEVPGLTFLVPSPPDALAARDAAATDVLTALDDVIRSVSVSGGVWHDPASAAVVVLDDTARSSRAPDVILTACEVADTLALTESVTDLVNVATVTYPVADGTAEVTVRAAEDPTAGVRKETIPTQLATEGQATSRATAHVSRYARTGWVLDGLTLDSRVEALDRTAAEALLRGLPTARIEVRDIPGPGPDAWAGYLEGWALTLWADRWTLTLDASPAVWSSALLTWAEVTDAPDLVPPSVLTSTSGWIAGGFGYAWPPGPLEVVPEGLRSVWNPAGVGSSGPAWGRTVLGLTPGAEYVCEIEVTGTGPRVRASALFVTSGAWITPTSTPQRMTVTFRPTGPDALLGWEAEGPNGSAGEVTVTRFRVFPTGVPGGLWEDVRPTQRWQDTSTALDWI